MPDWKKHLLLALGTIAVTVAVGMAVILHARHKQAATEQWTKIPPGSTVAERFQLPPCFKWAIYSDENGIPGTLVFQSKCGAFWIVVSGGDLSGVPQ